MKRLTIVIPVFNENLTLKDNIKVIFDRLANDGIDAELLLVDDGSKDSSWFEIHTLSDEYPDVRGIRLSRNFGKEAAIFAGINQVKTPLCLIMDSDLQHPPKVIAELLTLMDTTNCDIAAGVKKSRGKERLGYKLFAKTFYRIMKLTSGVDMDKSSDFILMNRKVIDALQEFEESSVFFRGLISWSGFTTCELPFTVEERKGDKSKFSAGSLLRFAVNSMLAYTSKPVYLTFIFAFLFFIGTIVLGVQTLINFFSGHAIGGFTTVILLILIFGCLALFSLGIIGAYIARIYNEVKHRPRHLISDRTKDNGSDN